MTQLVARIGLDRPSFGQTMIVNVR